MQVLKVFDYCGLNFLGAHIPQPPSKKMLRDMIDDANSLDGVYYCCVASDNKPLQKFIEKHAFVFTQTYGHLNIYVRPCKRTF